jgi:hypothetical protein
MEGSLYVQMNTAYVRWRQRTQRHCASNDTVSCFRTRRGKCHATQRKPTIGGAACQTDCR